MTAKYATGGAFGRILRDPHFWAPAVAAGTGALVTGAGMAVQKLMQAKQQARTYKEMLGLHPQLKTRDAAMVKRIYSSLHRVNPMMASDPMVAGAWVDTIMDSAGMDQSMMGRALLEGVKDLAQIRSHISQSQQRETSIPKVVGTAVQRQLEHGFSKAQERFGEVGALRRQIEERNEREKQRAVLETFERAKHRLTEAQKSLQTKLEHKGMSPQDAALYVAGVTLGNIPPLSSKVGEHFGDVERAIHGQAHRFGSRGVSGRGKTSGLLAAVRAI